MGPRRLLHILQGSIHKVVSSGAVGMNIHETRSYIGSLCIDDLVTGQVILCDGCDHTVFHIEVFAGLYLAVDDFTIYEFHCHAPSSPLYQLL